MPAAVTFKDELVVAVQGFAQNNRTAEGIRGNVNVLDEAINIERACIVARPVKTATHLLLDVIPQILRGGQVVYDYHGNSVSVVAVPLADGTALYYNTTQGVQYAHPDIYVVLASHYAGSYDYHPSYPTLFTTGFLLSEVGDGRKRFAERREKHFCGGDVARIKASPISKISGEHHIHFTAEEVLRAIPREKKLQALQALRLPTDTTTTMLGGVMLWLASLDPLMYEVIAETTLLDSANISQFDDRAKIISVKAKKYQNLVGVDLRPLFEPQVLINRVAGDVDWMTEKFHRVEPNLAQVSEDFVYKEALRLFATEDNTKMRPVKLTWNEFWSDRWQWAAAGSVHSQYKEDDKHIPKERELKNKFISLISMPDCDITRWSGRSPKIEAWASTKYEWGKLRAIYGCDLTSYVLATFACFGIENTLGQQFPVGDKARESYVRATVASTLQDRTPWCLDYEDFNSQHSIPAMQAVIRAYLNVHHDDLSPEQREALSWTHDSVANTTINDAAGTKSTYKVNGTLMSGWRLTTWMNTVLNYIYLQAAMGGRNPDLRSIHNGDDVLIGVKSFKDVQDVTVGLEKFQIRSKPMKCNFGSLAEFLRIDHMADGNGQYLARNIATLMHSRIETKKAISLTDALESFEERISEYKQRGGLQTIEQRLRDIYYNRIAPVYKNTKEDCYNIRATHRVNGGLCDHPEGLLDHEIGVDTVRGEVELPESLPGVWDFARRISTTFEVPLKVDEIAKRIRSATLNAVQMVRKHVEVRRVEDRKQAAVYRGIYGAYSDLAKRATTGKALLTGFPLQILGCDSATKPLMSLVSQSRDPMKLLSIVL
uniref:RNA-directed RNA polymerase n=1 Tax=Uromyces fabae virus TaxID=3069272 RepID=A0AA51UA31_9VIRU|nr:hypothetical protein [Uromyces fabae virus]